MTFKGKLNSFTITHIGDVVEMNSVETEFYEVLNSGCPDKLCFKYYLIEPNDRLKGMGKEERQELNIEFKKETSRIKKISKHEFLKRNYFRDFIRFLEDRYKYEVEDELFTDCSHTEKKS